MATSASAPNVPRRRQHRGGGVAIDGEHEQWPCRASGHMANVTVGFLLASPLANTWESSHTAEVGSLESRPRSALGVGKPFTLLDFGDVKTS